MVSKLSVKWTDTAELLTARLVELFGDGAVFSVKGDGQRAKFELAHQEAGSTIVEKLQEAGFEAVRNVLPPRRHL